MIFFPKPETIPATLRKLTKPVGHPWSDPPRRIRVARFSSGGSINPLTGPDVALSGRQIQSATRPIQYPRGVWYGSNHCQAEPSRGGCSPDLISVLTAGTETSLERDHLGKRSRARRLQQELLAPRLCRESGGVTPTAQMTRAIGRKRAEVQGSAPIARGGGKPSHQFHSGDGLGIHQPRSNNQGRARDRAKCPAVTRFKFSSRGGVEGHACFSSAVHPKGCGGLGGGRAQQIAVAGFESGPRETKSRRHACMALIRCGEVGGMVTCRSRDAGAFLRGDA